MEMFRKEKIKSKSLLTLEPVLLTTEWFLLYSRRKMCVWEEWRVRDVANRDLKLKKKNYYKQ